MDSTVSPTKSSETSIISNELTASISHDESSLSATVTLTVGETVVKESKTQTTTLTPPPNDNMKNNPCTTGPKSLLHKDDADNENKTDILTIKAPAEVEAEIETEAEEEAAAATPPPPSPPSTSAKLAGSSTRRSTRKPYLRITPIQLELFVNGHLHEDLSISAAAKRAGIPRSTGATLMKKYKNNNGKIPERRRRGRTAPPRLLPEHTAWIDDFLSKHEDATLVNIKKELLLAFPSIQRISIAALHRHVTLKCSRTLKRSRREIPPLQTALDNYDESIQKDNDVTKDEYV